MTNTIRSFGSIFHIAGKPFHELGMHVKIAIFDLRVLKGHRQTSQLFFAVKPCRYKRFYHALILFCVGSSSILFRIDHPVQWRASEEKDVKRHSILLCGSVLADMASGAVPTPFDAQQAPATYANVMPTATHRGQGFVTMASTGSASRIMSPPASRTQSRPPRVPTPEGPGVRHGSAEHGNNPGAVGPARSYRERSPSRSGSRPRPMGPQETSDWDELISVIHGRLDTIERGQRTIAQDCSRTKAVVDEFKTSEFDRLGKDYTAYKTYVEGRFKFYENIVSK